MASVPTISGPQETLSGGVGSGNFSVDKAPGDLVTGQAVKELGNASSELQKAINDAYISASDARASEAYLNFQDSVNGIMLGQNGALNKKGTEVTNGRNKKSFSDYYSGEIDKALNDAGKDLNPYQRRLLMERSKDYVDRNKLALTNHQIKEFEAQKKLVEAALLANDADAIAVNISDPEAMKQIRAEADRYLNARDRTLPQVVRERNRREYYSTAYKAGIYALLGNDDVKAAEKIFKEVKGDMTPEDVKALETTVQKASKASYAKETAERLWEVTKGDDAAAYKQILEIQDADYRNATLSAYNRKSKAEKDLVKAQMNTYVKDIYAAMDDEAKNPGTHTTLPPEAIEFIRKHDPAKAAKLEKLWEKGGGGFATETDIPTYQNLILMAANYDPDFQNLDLNELRDKLTRTDYNKLLTIKKNLPKDTLAAFIGYARERSKDMNANKRAALLSQAYDIYNAYFQGLGKAPDKDTWQALYDSLRHDFQGGWRGLFGDDITGQDILSNPAETLNKIGNDFSNLGDIKGVDPFALLSDARKFLIKNGKAVSDENIFKVAQDMAKQQLTKRKAQQPK